VPRHPLDRRPPVPHLAKSLAHNAWATATGGGAAVALLHLVQHDPGPPHRTAAIGELAELVIGYLRERPDASDTIAGIAEWWVLRQRLRVDLANLQNALSFLVEEGVLE
jgi:hypothetical protein